MKIFFIFFTSLILLTSCQKKDAFQKEFSCSNFATLENLETNFDFKEGFSVDIPKSWKTSLYFDESQSEIFSADTVKVFQETYLMEFAMKNGKINIDKTIQEKVHEVTSKNELTLVKENFIDFENYKGYYHLGKGKKNGMEIQVFQYYIKLSDEKYFLVNTEIYGSEKMEDRLCQIMSIIKTIKFIPEK